MVATDSAYASRAGVEILRAGGNAVDAAAAVSFALGVTRPNSTGCGGGGFMIIRFADGRTVVLDYRESAPAAATPDMFVRAATGERARLSPSRNGYLAVAVPGQVAGQAEALKRYGTMSWQRVLRPAIRLAGDGFPIDAHYLDSAENALGQYETDPSLIESCRYVYDLHLGGGTLPALGTQLRQPRLERFLERLATEGPEFFYTGDFATAFARTMRDHGGIVTVDDLAHYKVKKREPLVGLYDDYTLITMPSPSSGGTTILETLNILEAVTLEPPGPHAFIEAMKHAFADRSRWMADTDFADVPVDTLTSKAYAWSLAARVGRTPLPNADDYGSTQLRDAAIPPNKLPLPVDAGTSHYCIVDRWGNVVVATETINTAFGSLAAVDEWGVVLNNEMDDFTTHPGRPNAYGLTQSDRNAPEPGKRPLSSMSPTIVLRDGQPYMMLGASGGPRIISSVLNVLRNVLHNGKSLPEAVEAPRIHHQWQPNMVFFDEAPPDNLERAISTSGHTISEKRRTGIVQAIQRTPEGWVGVSDPRKGGRPSGY